MQHQSSTAPSSDSDTILCSNGRWMEVSTAEKYLNIKNIKALKRIGVPHLAFERGYRKGPPEYWSYEYVYCLANAPDGWEASTEYNISVADWCKLCDHYSHDENMISPSGEFKELFEKYTGCEATAASINLAYNENVLVSPSNLPQKAAKVTPPKKRKAAVAKKKVTTSRKVKGLCCKSSNGQKWQCVR